MAGRTMRLGDIQCRQRLATRSQKVLPAGHDPQMVWIDAATNPAKVIQLKAGRNHFNQLLVDHPMGSRGIA